MTAQGKDMEAQGYAVVVTDEADEAGLGSFSIRNDVIAAIAHEAAIKVHGVVDLAGDLLDGIAGMIGKKTNERGIRVVVDGDAVSLDLNVILKHGIRIPDVALQLQQTVKDAVEDMTGMLVSSVNVIVQGIKVVKESTED
jgi:uncharacterized alkaline shock family protein YloU